MDKELWLAMMDLLAGYQKTQIGCAVASLSIADHLAARPLSLKALVEKTGANPDGLRRLLRGAASLGLVRAESDDLFASTPCSRRSAATHRHRCVQSPSCTAAPTTGYPGDASLMP